MSTAELNSAVFRKKKLFNEIADDQIVEVQNKLNRRPRKILGYKIPAEV